MTPALELTRVSKIYGAGGAKPVRAVQSVSLDIAPGEIVALLGSSGCGKTSTLRMIAGFEEVSEGTIRIAGREVQRLAPAARNVAMAFEGYSLYPPLTVRENIAFALKSARLDAAEVARRVGRVAELLEIVPFLDRYPASISGGQQQRASLGRALVRQADLYLLDEPMGQLEPQLRAVLRARLKQYLKENGMTAILVTHDQTEANALSDRIAVMEGGVLQQYATPAALRDRPANLFTGTFIGEPPMNVVAATARAEGDGIALMLEGGGMLGFSTAEMDAEVLRAVLACGRVMAGVRPHAVRLGPEGLAARVTSNQWLGDQSHIAAELGGASVVAVSHDRLALRPGDEVRIMVCAADLHVFDPGSGVAISHGGSLA